MRLLGLLFAIFVLVGCASGDSGHGQSAGSRPEGWQELGEFLLISGRATVLAPGSEGVRQELVGIKPGHWGGRVQMKAGGVGLFLVRHASAIDLNALNWEYLRAPIRAGGAGVGIFDVGYVGNAESLGLSPGALVGSRGRGDIWAQHCMSLCNNPRQGGVIRYGAIAAAGGSTGRCRLGRNSLGQTVAVAVDYR